MDQYICTKKKNILCRDFSHAAGPKENISVR